MLNKIMNKLNTYKKLIFTHTHELTHARTPRQVHNHHTNSHHGHTPTDIHTCCLPFGVYGAVVSPKSSTPITSPGSFYSRGTFSEPAADDEVVRGNHFILEGKQPCDAPTVNWYHMEKLYRHFRNQAL